MSLLTLIEPHHSNLLFKPTVGVRGWAPCHCGARVSAMSEWDEDDAVPVVTPPKKGKKSGAVPGSGSGDQCLDPSCTMPKKKGARFCLMQQRLYDAMRYQAAQQSEVQLKAFNDKMQCPTTAVEEVHRFAVLNAAVPDCKHHPLITWAEWNQRQGAVLQKGENSQEAPFEEREWILRQVNKYGRDEEEMKLVWKAFFANKFVGRDLKGYKFQVRLWLPKKDAGRSIMMSCNHCLSRVCSRSALLTLHDSSYSSFKNLISGLSGPGYSWFFRLRLVSCIPAPNNQPCVVSTIALQRSSGTLRS